MTRTIVLAVGIGLICATLASVTPSAGGEVAKGAAIGAGVGVLTGVGAGTGAIGGAIIGGVNKGSKK